jgi:uncharacterized protein YjbI with pentapeptide repeats
VAKKPTAALEPREPERPDDEADQSLPDPEFSDEALYQNLKVDDLERESQRAEGVSFERVLFQRASFKDSKLIRASFYDTTLVTPNLSGCIFEGLIGQRILIQEARALGARLSGAVLDDLRVTGGDWRYALFLETRFRSAIFEGVNLREASFQGANLAGVRFAGCDLSRADFRDARLSGTDFRGSRIEGLLVHEKDLRGATISPDQAIDLVHLLGVTVAS